MAYSQDFAAAARRHLKAAQRLHEDDSAGAQPGCRAVAGYLFGLAGELAVKEMMRDSGMRPRGELEARRSDPFYAHFPNLKSLLRDTLSGRRHGELRKVAENDSLFNQWATDMRYAPTVEITEQAVTRWKASAETLVASMSV